VKRFLSNLFRREPSPPPLIAGGLYHLPDENGRFKVLKVLKLDDGGVHVRLFSNVFPSPPARVEESSLYLAGMDRKPDEPMGMGHLPISHRSFASWNAVFFQQSHVTDDELDGYRMWAEANGGYF
jgi:hypothetical protein